jgi:phosphate transport system substrate-binding protein
VNSRSLMTLVAGLGLAACGGGGDSNGPGGAASGGGVDLTGAGSTFIYPLLSSWTSDYAQRQGVRINYGSLGSGAGIRQFSEQTVDFGATDSPMTDEELAAARGGATLHLPVAMGAVVVTYNLPSVTAPLKLTGDVIADIFLGTVTKWNDPKLAAINPGVALPADDIIVVHRTDGSGTTYVFTDFLTSVSPAWANGPGRGKQINWPVGLGGKGNEGVSAQVKQTPGAVGYTELAYVRQNRLPAADVRNAAGNFVTPTIENVQAAAAGALETLPAESDLRVSLVNQPGAQSYPISAFTWLLLYEQQADSAKGRKLVDFVRWALTEGDSAARALDYAPLPDALQARVLERLDGVKLGAGR